MDDFRDLEYFRKQVIIPMTSSKNYAIQQAYDEPEEMLKKLNLLIDHHFRGHESCKFYADQLGVGLRTLSDLCKRSYGFTLFDLIQQRIIKEAKCRLANPRVPAKTVCYQLGFNDPCYFSKYFKARTGLSIRHYRRNCLAYAPVNEKVTSKAAED